MASILVIDDDGIYRAFIDQELTDKGYAVVTARDGDEGIALYRKLSPDLVITDMNMPRVNGAMVIRRIRKLNFKARIIAVSAEAYFHAVDYLKLARVLGANAVVRKCDPVDRLTAEVEILLAAAFSKSAAADARGEAATR